MKRKCKACGSPFRKGAAVLMCDRANPKKLTGAIVCPTCAGTAVAILPALPVVKCACGKDAVVCHCCADKGADVAKRMASDAKKLAKALRLRTKAYAKAGQKNQDEFSDGLAAGLEQAAGYLEKGAW